MVILKVIDLVRLLGSTDATKPIQVLTHNQCNNKTIHGHGEMLRNLALTLNMDPFAVIKLTMVGL